MNRIGFDNEKYIELQSANIMKRAERFGNKLYLEVGGKLVHDLHAARVLPGFDPDVKIRMLQRLKDKIEVLVCVFAGDIERQRVRADFGTTYDNEVLRLIDDVRDAGLSVRAVVMTRFESSMRTAANFADKLQRLGIDVFKHQTTVGYPDDVDRILSDEGYGLNPFIPTTQPIVAVIAPGPSSGKLATCLTQLYHENRSGNRAGYAKYETFPVWNLPLNHPLNIAYEAATADIQDFNQIDPFHLEAYGKTTVNYNRDVAAFPILRTLLSRVIGEDAYKSPTDMGVNMVGFAITDDEVVREASSQEIIRRWFHAQSDFAMGRVQPYVVERTKTIMHSAGLTESDRATVLPACKAAEDAREQGKGNNGVFCGAALQLHDGTIVTGKNSSLMYAASSVIINSLKRLAGIPDDIHLLPENVVQSIRNMKSRIQKGRPSGLNVSELLIALPISAIGNPVAEKALSKITELRGCDMHITNITTAAEATGLRRLGINLTTDPTYPTKNLFVQ